MRPPTPRTGPLWLPWWALCLALGLPALWLPLADLAASPDTWPALQKALVLRPDHGWAQHVWSPWTAAWLHGSPPHRWRNLAALACLALIGHRLRPPPRAVLALCLAWPCTQLGMLWQPELSAYVGLSGVLHAAWAVLALQLLRGPSPADRWVSGLMLVGIAAKLLMENPWQMRAVGSAASAINVTPWVHFWGAMMGALWWSLLSLRPGPRAAGRVSTD